MLAQSVYTTFRASRRPGLPVRPRPRQRRVEMASKVCPHCSSSTFRRVNRKGWLQRVLLPKLGLYPWECVHCRRRHLYRDEGGSSTRQSRPTFR